MLIRKFTCCLVLCSGVFMITGLGCGGGSSSATTKEVSTNPVLTGKDQVKERLQAVATSGSGGSALGGIRDALNELKKTEAALADQLLNDLTAMEQTDDAETLKKMATDMISKL